MKITDSIKDFIEEKREQAIIKLENRSASLLFFNWLATNWISVTICVILGGYALYYSWDNSNLRESLYKEELKNMSIDLDKIKKENEQFKKELAAIEKKEKDNKIKSLEVKEAVSKLPADKKKELLLDYKERLLDKKGL